MILTRRMMRERAAAEAEAQRAREERERERRRQQAQQRRQAAAQRRRQRQQAQQQQREAEREEEQQQPGPEREQVLVLVKPSGFHRQGAILQRIQDLPQCKLIEMRGGRADPDVVERHLEFQSQRWANEIRAHLLSGNLLAAVFEGNQGIINDVLEQKQLIREEERAYNEVRDIPFVPVENFMHSSENVDEAKAEIRNWMQWIRGQQQ